MTRNGLYSAGAWLGALLLLVGCAGRTDRISLARMEVESRSPAAPALVNAHASAAHDLQAAASVKPPLTVQIDAMIAQVERVKRNLEKMLEDTAGVVSFRDFGSAERKAALEAARDPERLAALVADGLTIEEVEALVFARNPRIGAAEKELRSAIERYPQVVYVEVLLAQYTTFLAELALGVGPQFQKDPVALKFPIPGVLALKTDLVSREVDLARERFVKEVRDRIVEAHEAFFELWYLRRALGLEKEILGYLRDLERTVSSRLEAGRAEKSQVLQVQVEISSLEDELITLDEELKTTRSKLRELLDLPPEAPLGDPSYEGDVPRQPTDMKALYAKAAAERQEIRLARIKVRRVETAIELAEKMTYPDWTLGLGYFEGLRPVGPRRRPTGVTPEGFTPRPPQARTFWFGQSEAYLREVRQLRLSLLKALEAERRSAEFLVREQCFALDEAGRRLRLYEDVLLSQARQAYRDTLAAYEGDTVDFLNVIDTLRQWLRFELERDRARRDDLVAFVRLEAAVGTRLER